MADFSISFDSDNPFAEPETAPKAAPAAGQTEPPAVDAVIDPVPTSPVSTAESAESPDDGAFSLSAFDFAFDDGASTNDNLPTRQKVSEDTPRAKTPGEAAFAEFDFGAPEIDTKTDVETDTEMAEQETSFPEISPIESQSVEEENLLGEPTFDLADAGVETVELEATDARDVAPGAEANEIEVTETEVSDQPSKNALSDLDEFNALDFDLGNSNEEIEAENETLATVGESDFSDVSADMFAPPTDETLVNEDSDLELTNVESEAAVAASESESATQITAVPPVDADEEVEDESRTEARPLRVKALLNVAILGAAGIGKNHARWFHRNGCHVSAFLGTSDDSTAKTESDLAQDFAFEGKAYTDLTELLATEKPDIVCVATPPELHFAHVLQSLEAGAHVLCEKPLVYAPTRKFRENRDGAKELVKVAAKRKLVLGTQLQYGAATPILCKLAGLSPSDVGDFAMELETLNPNAPLDPHGLWIDLGPHPVSIAQMLAGPGAKLAEETISFEPFQNEDKTEVLARFGVNCADGRLLMSRVVVRALRNAQSQPRRRFSFNGQSVSYAPLNSRKSNFQAQFVAPDGYASVYADPVDYLVGDFVRACREGRTPLISGDFGRENLEWMLKIAGEN